MIILIEKLQILIIPKVTMLLSTVTLYIILENQYLHHTAL